MSGGSIQYLMCRLIFPQLTCVSANFIMINFHFIYYKSIKLIYIVLVLDEQRD